MPGGALTLGALGVSEKRSVVCRHPHQPHPVPAAAPMIQQKLVGRAAASRVPTGRSATWWETSESGHLSQENLEKHRDLPKKPPSEKLPKKEIFFKRESLLESSSVPRNPLALCGHTLRCPM